MHNQSEYASRRRKLDQLCSLNRDVLLGREFSLVPIMIQEGHFSSKAVESWVNKLLQNCTPTRYDNEELISTYLQTVVCYLFSECNKDDQTIRSIYMLLTNSQMYWGVPFDDSPFGIMLSDAKISTHTRTTACEAHSALMEKMESYRNQLDRTDIRKHNLSGVSKYLDEFIRTNAPTIINNDEDYQHIVNELYRISFRARRLSSASKNFEE